MNESIYCDTGDLPDPPDNLEEWERLPEDFRETVAERFESGIANEWALNCDRVDHEENVRELRRKERKAA